MFKEKYGKSPKKSSIWIPVWMQKTYWIELQGQDWLVTKLFSTYSILEYHICIRINIGGFSYIWFFNIIAPLGKPRLSKALEGPVGISPSWGRVKYLFFKFDIIRTSICLMMSNDYHKSINTTSAKKSLKHNIQKWNRFYILVYLLIFITGLWVEFEYALFFVISQLFFSYF